MYELRINKLSSVLKPIVTYLHIHLRELYQV